MENTQEHILDALKVKLKFNILRAEKSISRVKYLCTNVNMVILLIYVTYVDS